MNIYKIRLYDKKNKIMVKNNELLALTIDCAKRAVTYERFYLDDNYDLRRGGFRVDINDVDFMMGTGVKENYQPKISNTNFKEVYEGDVVVCSSEGGRLEGYITYIDGQFVVTEDEGKFISYNFLWQNAENIEIVGNIYEQNNKNGGINNES